MLKSKQFESWFELAKLNGVLFDSEYDASKITWHSAMIHFENQNYTEKCTEKFTNKIKKEVINDIIKMLESYSNGR